MTCEGKVVVVTGSTRGFGHAVARALLARGACVVISGRKQETVDQVVAQLAGAGGGPDGFGLGRRGFEGESRHG